MIRKFLLVLAIVAGITGAACAEGFRVVQMNVMNASSGKLLRGLLYMPETDSRVPLVICAHELGSNHRRRWPQYGEALAADGIAVYTFGRLHAAGTLREAARRRGQTELPEASATERLRRCP